MLCIMLFCNVTPIVEPNIIYGLSYRLLMSQLSLGFIYYKQHLIIVLCITMQAIQARGGVYLEAPVVGSRVPALEGQLTILASGDRKLFDDCFSCFEAIGKKSLYLGRTAISLHLPYANHYVLFKINRNILILILALLKLNIFICPETA